MDLQNQQRNNLMAPLLQWRYNKCQNWIQQKTNDLFLRLERDSTLDEIVVLEEAGGEEEEEDEEEGENEGEEEDEDEEEDEGEEEDGNKCP
jgi:hypothetical protein